MSETDLLDQLVDLNKRRSALEAEHLQLLEKYRVLRADPRSTPDEIALALHISRAYAEVQLHLAETLTERLPDTLDALAAGRLDLSKARAIADITAALSVEDARIVEAKVLPKAETRVLGQVKASLRYHRDRVDPQSAEQRRQQARADRRVTHDDLDNHTADLRLTGPADRLALVWAVIDAMARRLRAGGDARTLDMLRFDTATDLLLGKEDQRAQVTVYLHVPATTLAGITDDPGILAGYGPMTAEACKELAGRESTWRRVFCDPATGTVKDVDRRTYRPPAGLFEYIHVRDATCVAPGCMRPAHQCQIDHTVAWEDFGCTCEENLGSLCVRHHRLKHLCGWKLTQPKPGYFTWTSPVGQQFDGVPEAMLNP